MNRATPSLAVAIAVGLMTAPTSPAGDAVDFNRDIRPILSNNCLRCHGPDRKERKAGLRLDIPEGAFADLGDYAAIVPGKPEQSEVLRRVTSTDRSRAMPPRKTGKRLTPREVELLT